MKNIFILLAVFAGIYATDQHVSRGSSMGLDAFAEGAPSTHDSSASASPPAAKEEVIVQMKSISFGPKVLDIKVGQSVVWENVSLTDHSATSDDEGKTFNTGLIGPKGRTKPVLFDKAGIYRYHCILHGRTMSGLINVGAKTK